MKQSNSTMGTFKGLFKRKSENLNNDKNFEKFNSELKEKQILINHLELYLKDVEKNIQDSENIEIFRFGGELKKIIKAKILCSIFEAKNEFLGINYESEPLLIKIYKLKKSSLDKFVPAYQISLDLCSEPLMNSIYLSFFNSSNKLNIDFQNKIKKNGLQHNIR